MSEQDTGLRHAVASDVTRDARGGRRLRMSEQDTGLRQAVAHSSVAPSVYEEAVNPESAKDSGRYRRATTSNERAGHRLASSCCISTSNERAVTKSGGTATR